jgi:hypothetical protein
MSRSRARTDVTLRALRHASPRSQPGFHESLARYDELRAQITASPTPVPRRVPQLASRRRVLGLSAAALAATLALAGVIVVLTVGATSPPSAYAAARRALAATAAASSGTMTITTTGSAGTVWPLDTTRWNADNIAISSGARHLLGPDRQLLLIGRGAYVQRADGSWVHYGREADVGATLVPVLQLAHDNVAGSAAEQILSLATDLRKVAQPDGTTLYTGTIPNNTTDVPGIDSTDDSIMRIIDSLRVGNQPGDPGGYHRSLQLTMSVAGDGLVRKIGLTFRQRNSGSPEDAGSTTWTVAYRRLGSTAPITAPARSTPGDPR